MSRKQVLMVFCVMLVCAMGTTQCSLVLCTRYYNAIAEKRGTCPGSDADKDEQIKNCESRLSQCTNDDREKVSDMITCVEGLEKCQADLSAVGWATKYASCTTRLQGISQTCTEAFLK